MIPPCSAKPSVSPTVKVLDPFRLLTIVAEWFFSVTGTNTMWHTLSVSFDFSYLTSSGWAPTVREHLLLDEGRANACLDEVFRRIRDRHSNPNALPESKRAGAV